MNLSLAFEKYNTVPTSSKETFVGVDSDVTEKNVQFVHGSLRTPEYMHTAI